MRAKRALVIAATLAALLGAATIARADAPPPTQGGNGAGQSGQCTGQPDGRPAVCP